MAEEMISISIIFVEQDSEGEICDGCNEIIVDKKYTMFIDFGDPSTSYPLDVVYCLKCKDEFEE